MSCHTICTDLGLLSSFWRILTFWSVIGTRAWHRDTIVSLDAYQRVCQIRGSSRPSYATRFRRPVVQDEAGAKRKLVTSADFPSQGTTGISSPPLLLPKTWWETFRPDWGEPPFCHGAGHLPRRQPHLVLLIFHPSLVFRDLSFVRNVGLV